MRGVFLKTRTVQGVDVYCGITTFTDWDGLRDNLRSCTWEFLSVLAADEAVMALTQSIIDVLSEFAPQRFVKEHKSTHPWIDERVLSLGTDRETETRDACSQGVLREFGKNIQREKHCLSNMRCGSKAWRSKLRRRLQHKDVGCSILALRYKKDGWVSDVAGKVTYSPRLS